jgi:hypothetical protein
MNAANRYWSAPRPRCMLAAAQRITWQVHPRLHRQMPPRHDLLIAP